MQNARSTALPERAFRIGSGIRTRDTLRYYRLSGGCLQPLGTPPQGKRHMGKINATFKMPAGAHKSRLMHELKAPKRAGLSSCVSLVHNPIPRSTG